ncbi:tape measure protein, partial [Micrococcus sp.]|uniref:tape measure protein n=1 Tax=Micrococcus sp. TaxID=1271 RepID=UPI0026DCFFA0
MPVIGVAELLVVPTFSGLQSKVGQQVDAAVKATPTAGAQTAGSRLGSFLTESLSTATGIGLAKAGELAMSQVTGIFTTGFKRLADIDTAKAKMRGLGFTVEEVDSLMASALTSVKGTPYGLGEAATAAAAAVASGIQPGEDMDRVLGAIAESAAAAGTPLTEMADLYLDVAAKGKAQNDVLGRVAERGIPIYQELADMLGVTKDEVFKLGTAGKIDFATFEQAMINASGNVAREMGQTLPGAWMNFQAAVSRVGANLMGGIYPMMVQGVLGVTRAMAPLEATAKVVGDSFVGLLTRAGGVWNGLVTLFASGDVSAQLLTALGVGPDSPVIAGLLWVRDTAMAMGAGIQAAAAAVAGWVTQHTAVFQVLGSMLAGAAGAWALVKGVMLTVTGVAGLVSGAFGLVVGAVTRLWSGLQLLWGLMLANPVTAVILAIGALAGALIWLYQNNETARAIMQAAWAGIQAAVQTAWVGYIQPALQAFGAFLTTVVGPALLGFWQGVVVPAFAAIGAAVSTAWNGLILPGLGALSDFVDGTLAPEVVQLWQTHVVPAWTGIVAAVQSAWAVIDHLGGAIQGAIQFIQGLVSFVAAVFRGDWAAAWNGAKDMAIGAFKFLWHAVNVVLTVNLLGAIRGGLASMLGLFRGGMSSITSFFGSAWNGIVALVRGAWTGLLGAARSGASGLSSLVSGLVQGILRFFGNMASGMGSIIRNAWSVARSAFGGATAALRTMVSQMVQGILRFFANLKSGVSNSVSSLWRAAKSQFSNGIKSVTDTVSTGLLRVQAFFRDLPGRIKFALGDLGGLLKESGRALLAGFLDGISDGFDRVKNFVADSMQKVREFFPFSPAKRGAFSGRGYTTYSGRALSRDFGDSIAGQAGYVATRTESVMDAAAAALAGDLPGPGVSSLADLVRGPGG